MGGLKRHTRNCPDAYPYAYFTNITRKVCLELAPHSIWKVEVVLRVAAEAPKATCDEFFLMLLLSLSPTPG